MEEIVLNKKWANYFGIERIDNKGKRRYQLRVIRGNGDLVLTKSGVYFTRWLPKKEFFIPSEKIKKVDIGRFHNLKTKLFPILKIHYEENNEIYIFGVCIGWKKDTLIWKDKIEEIAGKI